MDLQKAISTQLANISQKTGKTIEELGQLVGEAALQKHGEKVAWVKANLGLGHGDANALVLHISKSAAAATELDNPLDALYDGPKAQLRPIHDAIMAEVKTWGDFEEHPKKGYIALRRKKQFAMLGPASAKRVELGLNAKDLQGSDRLLPQAPGGMCQYKVNLTEVSQVDADLFGWLKAAFEASAG